MNYQQLVNPNLSVVGQDGYCLAYVENVFATPHLYPNATTAWGATQFKHTDNPPTDISVPVWFSYSGTDGHVAVSTPQGVYSTTAQGDKVFPDIQALMDYIKEDIAYLGWSEDLANVRLAQGEQDMVQTEEDNRQVFLAVVGRNPYPQEVGRYIGKEWVAALNDCESNVDRHNIDTMISAYYANSSKTPEIVINLKG